VLVGPRNAGGCWALEVGDKERRTVYEAFWARGGAILASFRDLLTDPRGERNVSRVRSGQGQAGGPRSRYGACARSP
jgi:hypothetical protein